MVLMARRALQERFASKNRDSAIGGEGIEVNSKVSVLSGRQFPNFSSGDTGRVVRIDHEALNCDVMFEGTFKAVSVALRHLKLANTEPGACSNRPGPFRSASCSATGSRIGSPSLRAENTRRGSPRRFDREDFGNGVETSPRCKSCGSSGVDWLGNPCSSCKASRSASAERRSNTLLQRNGTYGAAIRLGEADRRVPDDNVLEIGGAQETVDLAATIAAESHNASSQEGRMHFDILETRLQLLTERHLAEIELLKRQLETAVGFGRKQQARVLMLEEHIRKMGVSVPPNPDLFDKLDKNHDGVISRQEFEQAMIGSPHGQFTLGATIPGSICGVQAACTNAQRESPQFSSRRVMASSASSGALSARQAMRPPHLSAVSSPHGVDVPIASRHPAVSPNMSQLTSTPPRQVRVIPAEEFAFANAQNATAMGLAPAEPVVTAGRGGSCRRALSASAAPGSRRHLPVSGSVMAPPLGMQHAPLGGGSMAVPSASPRHSSLFLIANPGGPGAPNMQPQPVQHHGLGPHPHDACGGALNPLGGGGSLMAPCGRVVQQGPIGLGPMGTMGGLVPGVMVHGGATPPVPGLLHGGATPPVPGLLGRSNFGAFPFA